MEGLVGLFFLLFLTILLCAELQLSVYQASGLYLEDALAASNLASAVIDVEEYGISHTVRIANPSEAYYQYLEALKENLHLNDSMEGDELSLISGPVTVVKYIIYNVEEERITVHHVLENGRVWTEQGVKGSITAPNGILIENTGVYSEISFPVKGFLGVTVTAHKGKLVDIVST